MKALRTFACAAVVAAVMCVSASAAMADEVKTTNHQLAPGVWYENWIGPSSLSFATPDYGVTFQNDFSGEVTYVDDQYMSIALDESGDAANFYLFEGLTQTTPSMDAIRIGSKVEVRSDDSHRVRFVKTIPFYKWLKAQE